MTAIAPEPSPLDVLPSMPASAEPLLIPGLLTGLGLGSSPAPCPVPGWVTDRDVIASIEAGLIEIPDDLTPRQERES
ncbi:hypothetical protein [Streptomyces sp. G1]|uniref:hypothetical protein n=1 Tax=Streptomyces sp. G1 TaxID=361572 RepID=UPI002030B9EE|nr:hypothetical protein [Streptomyces sp. G1]MCM1974597.1 hypothetical protein [Streptomyces sp. G1]